MCACVGGSHYSCVCVCIYIIIEYIVTLLSVCLCRLCLDSSLNVCFVCLKLVIMLFIIICNEYCDSLVYVIVQRQCFHK